MPNDADKVISAVTKGDLWELFCVAYLKLFLGYDEVYRMAQAPRSVLMQLGIVREDYGIDIVCVSGSGADRVAVAVQCKYRQNIATSLHWKRDLATFFALCWLSNERVKWHKVTHAHLHTCTYA